MSASGVCAADCRRASKAASQAAWLARPPNNDYFRGPVHVFRVQAWRAAHPGYSRNRARPSRALQDLFICSPVSFRARIPEFNSSLSLTAVASNVIKDLELEFHNFV